MRMSTVIILPAAILVCGCSSTRSFMMVSAEPLSVDAQQISMATTGERRAFLASVVKDSMDKCKAFSDSLVIGQATVNTTGDILATITSALATAFTKLETIHALTAASTIITGTRAAIDSDVFAKASIASFHTALNLSYWSHIAAYNDALGELDENNVVVGQEVNKINSYHAECTLAAAQASITSTLEAVGGASNGTPEPEQPETMPQGEADELQGESRATRQTPPSGVPGSSLAR